MTVAEHGTKNEPHILVVEDDQELAKLTQEYLQNNGYRVSCVDNGVVAVQRILQNTYDLLLLDLMLPGIDGIEVCRQVRQQFQGPIVMLTAKDDDVDQIIGLEIGADDYLNKPVKPRVLLAKVKAHLRREERLPDTENQRPLRHATKQQIGDLVIDNSRRIATVDGHVLDLTTPEFDLLWIFTTHVGVILSRDDIFNLLSGIEYDGQNRRIDILVSHLRAKIEADSASPEKIKTVRGKGYLFVPVE